MQDLLVLQTLHNEMARSCKVYVLVWTSKLKYNLRFEWLSHSAAWRMSPSLMAPRLVLYVIILQWEGWKSAAVITSVNSSMLFGLMSTISKRKSYQINKSRNKIHTNLKWILLKLWFEIPRLHRLTRKSSADKNVSPSLFKAIELIWYVWALA